MHQVIQKFLPTEIDTESGTFTGVAWVYDTPDRTGDIIRRGAFQKSIERLMDSGSTLPLLFNHDSSQPIGSLVLFDTEDGLMVQATLELSIEKANEVYKLVKAKAMSLSIGFMFDEENVYKREDARIFSEVDLFECSVVSVPAHSKAVISEVKSFKDVSTVRDFEVLVRDALGLSRRQSKKLAAVGYNALIECDAQKDADEVDQQSIIKALKCATTSIKSI